MSEQWITLLLDAILDTALIVVVGGSVIAIGLGLVLIAAPGLYLAMSGTLNKWISTRRSLRPMEIPRNKERFFYHHHRLFGLLVAIGAVYTLSYFLLDYDPQKAYSSLQQQVDMHPEILGWALDAGSLALVLTNILVLIIGAIVFIRPSLLKGLETWGNKWVSTRHATRFLDNNYSGLDRFTLEHPRLVGGLLLIGGIYVPGMLAMYLI